MKGKVVAHLGRAVTGRHAVHDGGPDGHRRHGLNAARHHHVVHPCQVTCSQVEQQTDVCATHTASQSVVGLERSCKGFANAKKASPKPKSSANECEDWLWACAPHLHSTPTGVDRVDHTTNTHNTRQESNSPLMTACAAKCSA
jgi:hypothetical protein